MWRSNAKPATLAQMRAGLVSLKELLAGKAVDFNGTPGRLHYAAGRHIPVLMLTARDDETDLIVGLARKTEQAIGPLGAAGPPSVRFSSSAPSALRPLWTASATLPDSSALAICSPCSSS